MTAQESGTATVCRTAIPDWKIRVPKRANELMFDDCVVVDDGADSWHVGHLVISRRTLTVQAEPANASYPSRLDVGLSEWVTVLLNPSQIGTPRPCGQRITAHAPQQRGWYTDAGGWDVGCGCGWTADDVVPGNKGHALTVWETHKASVINALLARNDRGHAAARLQHVPGLHDHQLWWSRKYRLIRMT